eukprot:TRINITY_DN16158_c0_g1_i1.p1 TRINITY_DN16158_c0_g1~~TRINITY_DN16158_c0_g1_i1.p1  ORF type:complete len:301 (+),score=39.49 TRINITY_DN16158_c0_g1_i1:180-1082(+)
MEREERKPGDKELIVVNVDSPELEEPPKEEAKRKVGYVDMYNDDEIYAIICLARCYYSGLKKGKLNLWKKIAELYITNHHDSILKTRTVRALNNCWDRLYERKRDNIRAYRQNLRKKLKPEVIRRIHMQIIEGIDYSRAHKLELASYLNKDEENEIRSFLLYNLTSTALEGSVQTSKKSNSVAVNLNSLGLKKANVEFEEEKLTEKMEKEIAESKLTVVDSGPGPGNMEVIIHRSVFEDISLSCEKVDLTGAEVSTSPRPWTTLEDAVLCNSKDPYLYSIIVTERGLEAVNRRKRDLGLL